MTTMEDLRPLVDYPMERLDAEYKDWLDLRENHGRATLAKAAIALANHGGGHIVIGLAEDGASFTSKAKPENCPEITQDAVNSQCAGMLSRHFNVQCERFRIILVFTIPLSSYPEI